MEMNPVAETLVVCFALAGVAWDMLRGAIPDWLTLPAIAVGLALGVASPSGGLAWALAGAATGFGLMALAHLSLGGVGGGDAKFMAALGAFAGPSFVLVTIVYAAGFGLLLACAALVRRGPLLPSIRSGARRAAMALLPSLRRAWEVRTGPALRIPYCAALGLGALCLLLEDALHVSFIQIVLRAF